MVDCFKCGQEMNRADGCDPDRTITFADGETSDPIPFGEAEMDRAFDEVLENYEDEIESGGRGRLSADQIRQERDEFTARWDAESHNSRSCHDCGATVGEYHHPGCDMEACPKCGEQYFICECPTREKDQIWGVDE